MMYYAQFSQYPNQGQFPQGQPSFQYPANYGYPQQPQPNYQQQPTYNSYQNTNQTHQNYSHQTSAPQQHAVQPPRYKELNQVKTDELKLTKTSSTPPPAIERVVKTETKTSEKAPVETKKPTNPEQNVKESTNATIPEESKVV